MGGDALRQCKCGASAYSEADLTKFVSDARSNHGRRNICNECNASRQRKTYTGRKVWPSFVRERYGCTREEYEERMESSSTCEICGTSDKLCYDHDHDTMEFRGILCNTCNLALGGLGDSVSGLQRAIDYLTKRNTL